MRVKSVALAIIALIIALPVMGQSAPPWEVRTYLSPYTDGAGSGTGTWTWNMTALRHRYVCPYCGYSTAHANPGDTCPDPWDAHGPAVELVEASPRERVLDYISITAEDAAGQERQPLVGRPFHPGSTDFEWSDFNAGTGGAGDTPWEAPELADVASFVTARFNSQTLNGLIQDGYGLRFLIVKPGSVRPSARFQYISPAEQALPVHVLYRQVGVTPAGQYKIWLNPYRVSDGDIWYIRHTETAAGDVRVEVYSKLYGLDFDSEGALDVTSYAGGRLRVLTDSGAAMIEIPEFGAPAAGIDSGAVVKFVVNSNTQTMPSPSEMDFDMWDGNGIYDDPEVPGPDPTGQEEPVFPAGSIGEPLSHSQEPKGCYVVADTTDDPILSTADPAQTGAWPVVEKDGEGFNTAQIWPYHLPPEATGRGRIIFQWSQLAAAGALASQVMNGTNVFYRSGGEWQYMVDLAAPGNPVADNASVAQHLSLPPDVAFIDSYFMVTRPDVDLDYTADFDPTDAHDDYLGNDIRVNSLDGNEIGPFDNEAATGGFPNLIIGSLQSSPPEHWGGEYNPGARTPSRTFSIANRSSVPMLVCPAEDGGCGARYQDGFEIAPGVTLAPGSICPACRSAALVREDASANLQYDAHTPPMAQIGSRIYRMAADAVHFGPNGTRLSPGTLSQLQMALVDVPPYQPPSVPPGATFFENDLSADQGYYGTMMAFHRPAAEGDRYAENHTWDWYYLAPNDGSKWAAPDDPDISDTAADNICPVCGTRVSDVAHMDRDDGDAAEDCPFCTATPNKPASAPFLTWDTLTAEEYDPFGLWVSVQRKTGLAANSRTVDLGWVAPGVWQDAPNTTNGPTEIQPGDVPVPADVSNRAELPVRNEGNIAAQAQMRASNLFRTDIDSTVRSYERWAATVPVTVGTLFRYLPGSPDDVAFPPGAWTLWAQEATGAAGETGTALLQGGVRSTAGAYAGTIKPVPLGQPAGNYANEVLLFVDLDSDGVLDFYDAMLGVTNTGVEPFDPDVDQPFEPVASFATRMRVVESRLPQSDFYSKDVEPAMLYDESRNNLQVLWAGQRTTVSAPGAPAPAGLSAADEPLPTDPFNILYANADANLFAGDPLYRGWLWVEDGDEPEAAQALSASTGEESNSSPYAWIDPSTNDRWAMWHRALATNAGVSSQLRFDSSSDVTWNGSAATEFLFGTGGAHRGLTGFVRQGSTNRHWIFWHAGQQQREHLRYRWEFEPGSGTVPEDDILHVSNAADAGPYDFFEVTIGGEQVRFRKPAINPFTYVKQPSVFDSIVGPTGAEEYEVDVFFTGHLRALGNSDICWTRFNFGPVAEVDAGNLANTAADNYGKIPFPRNVNSALPFGATPPAVDARRMPAIYDQDGDIRGYPGEQLEPSPRRQSFQSRDIDWLVTARIEDPAAPDEPFNFATKPDWTNWKTEAKGLEEYFDPKFYVGVVTRDPATGNLVETLYAVSWTEGVYDRSSGLYTVTPVLQEISASGVFDLPLNPGHPDAAHLNELIAPSARRQAEDEGAFAGGPGDYSAFMWPSVTLQISPASGTLKWSSPLFNPDNPGDPLAVFTSTNTPEIVDVVMYGSYTPFVRRVTTDEADDDSPSAFFNMAGSQRLTVFWRRNYASAETPHFGRPVFMHRTFTRALQLGRVAAPGDITEVYDLTTGETLSSPGQWQMVSEPNGIIRINFETSAAAERVGHRIRVTYNTGAPDDPQVEQHRVIGWSLEETIPINTVIAGGPIRVFPEVYDVPGTNAQAVRYWLLWSSNRGVYDLREPAQNGQQVRQSSDVYLAVVAPEHAGLIAEINPPQVGR